MNIYINGCSFSSGTKFFQGTKDLLNWGFWLNEKFDTVVNQAIEGGSNHRLIRQTTDFINNTENLDDWIIVIQLTDPERT